MKVTENQLRYGFGKCRKCEQILPLEAFEQWMEGSHQRRAVTCKQCRTDLKLGNMRNNGGSPSPFHLGATYWANCETIRIAKGKPCADCGRKFPPVCMDFDHVAKEGKAYNVSQMRSLKSETLAIEIQKCEVVCACCHRIRTAKRGHIGAGRPKA